MVQHFPIRDDRGGRGQRSGLLRSRQEFEQVSERAWEVALHTSCVSNNNARARSSRRREAVRTWKATCTGLLLTIVGGVSFDAWACSEAASFDLAADAAVGLGFYVLVDVVCVLAVFAVPGVARVAWQMCQDTETHRGCVVSARQCRRKCCRRRYDGSAAERLPLPGGPREARRKK